MLTPSASERCYLKDDFARYLKSVETGSDAEGYDRVRMQVPQLFSVCPAPRYAFRRGMSIPIPDSPIATAGALPALGL
jgi:hypothetical protein